MKQRNLGRASIAYLDDLCPSDLIFPLHVPLRTFSRLSQIVKHRRLSRHLSLSSGVSKGNDGEHFPQALLKRIQLGTGGLFLSMTRTAAGTELLNMRKCLLNVS